LFGKTESFSLERFTINLKIKNVEISGNNILVSVERGVGAGNLIAIKFVFSDGVNSEVIERETLIDEFEEETFSFDLIDIGLSIETVSIAPIYLTDSGKRIIGNIVSVYNLQSGEEMNELFDVLVEDMDLTDNTIIIYNKNNKDAYDIAKHYADARGIDDKYLCEVQISNGQIAEGWELLGIRKTIVNDCICGNILGEDCGIENIAEVAEKSPITHMVIIRGIPARLVNLNWSGEIEEAPSFDYYLSIMLYGDEEDCTLYSDRYPDGYGGCNFIDHNYALDGGGGDLTSSNYISSLCRHWRNIPGCEEREAKTFQAYDSISGYVRPIKPDFDKIVAYGRIEAMTKQRTFDLIDRTIEVENKGVSGNFLTGISPSAFTYPIACAYARKTYNFFRDLTSSRADECYDYLEDWTLKWPYKTCRTGATKGQIPGENYETIDIPLAINAGIYLGRSAAGNGQKGFDGFYNMLNWRKTDEDCIPLCEDTSNPEECKKKSTDYFKEINTDCVGVADGFLGMQYRSFPVQYYGFFPTGWVAHADSGHTKTTPVILEGDSYKDDEQFTDDKYFRIGSLNTVPNPKCVKEDGTIVSCNERLGLSLDTRIEFDEAFILEEGETRDFTIRLRYRNPAGNPENSWGINVGTTFVIDGDASWDNPLNYGLVKDDYSNGNWYSQFIRAVKDEHTDWTLHEYTISANRVELNHTGIKLLLQANPNYNIYNWLEIDGIEIIDDSGENILPVGVGSFSLPFNETHSGDYAANVIDRLGGIAWWGSSSHHITMGGAFSRQSHFAGAFYSGRSLGESLAYTDKAMSGIIYGDPLYRPSGAKIYIENGLIKLNSNELGKAFNRNTEADLQEIYINAFHGQGNLDKTNWQLSFCDSDIDSCDESDSWIEFKTGNRAVFNYKIDFPLSEIIKDFEKNFVLRLRVWNPGEEKNDLKNYAYFFDCVDKDLDGFSIDGGACGEVDCNDNDDTIYPGAYDDCNGIDNNCDGIIPTCQNEEDFSDFFSSPSTFNFSSGSQTYITLPVNTSSRDLETIFTPLPNPGRIIFKAPGGDIAFKNGEPWMLTSPVSVYPGEVFKVEYGSGSLGIEGEPYVITIEGESFTEPIPIKLNNYYNLIGIPYCAEEYTASKVLSEIQAAGGNCFAISIPDFFSDEEIIYNPWWSNEEDYLEDLSYKPFLEESKEDFQIRNYIGYEVYCDEETDVIWTPSC